MATLTPHRPIAPRLSLHPSPLTLRLSASLAHSYDIRYALKTIDVKNLGNANPDPLVSLCHHSHPTLVQRVAAVGAQIERESKKVKRKRA